MMIVQISFIV